MHLFAAKNRLERPYVVTDDLKELENNKVAKTPMSVIIHLRDLIFSFLPSIVIEDTVVTLKIYDTEKEIEDGGSIFGANSPKKLS